MERGAAGIRTGAPGATGGWRGMNGAQRRIVLIAILAFVGITTLVLIANANATMSDLAATGERVPDHLVWSWEWTSMLAWLSVYPALWWASGRVTALGLRWPAILAAALAGAVVASGWHIGLVVALRHLYYAAVGEGPYRFFALGNDRILYEFRKDLATYAQFLVAVFVVRLLLSRTIDAALAGEPIQDRKQPDSLVVADGQRQTIVPLAEVDQIRAAGNYVELDWSGRRILHRSSLGAMEEAHGEAFVRIHRSVLVRRQAMRELVTDRSGDFSVLLTSGQEVRGSRRYRTAAYAAAGR